MAGPFHVDRGEASRVGRSLMLAFQRFALVLSPKASPVSFAELAVPRFWGRTQLNYAGSSSRTGWAARRVL